MVQVLSDDKKVAKTGVFDGSQLKKDTVRYKLKLFQDNSVGNLSNLWKLELPKLDYFIRGLIPCNQITIFCGASESGKTTLLLYCALSISSGKDTFLGTVKKGRVLYIDEEMGLIGFQRKILQLAESNNINAKDVSDRFIYRCMSNFKLDTDNGKKTLKQTLIDNEIDVVFIDSLLACTVGDVGTVDMRKLREINKICYECGVALIYNHHVPKIDANKSKLTLSSLFGSSDIGNGIDNAFGIIYFKSKNSIRIQQIKGRYTPEEEKIDINVTFKGMQYSNVVETKDISKNDFITAIVTFKGNKPMIYTELKDGLVPIVMSEPTLSKYLKQLVDSGEFIKRGDKYV